MAQGRREDRRCQRLGSASILAGGHCCGNNSDERQELSGRVESKIMRVRQKVKNVLRGILQTWGTPEVKRSLWNKEFSEGRWDFIDNTPGDPVYGYIEKYCRNGSIL